MQGVQRIEITCCGGRSFGPNEGSVLRIQRAANGEVIFRLIGRVDSDSIAQLKDLFALEAKGRQIILDLKDVTIVNRDAVLFFSACETDHVELKDCPLYIREWINRERAGETDHIG